MPAARSSKPLPDLCGIWHITRRIWGENARFIGTATILQKDAVLRYHEAGALCVGTASFDAFRDYIYEPSGDRLLIRHPNGDVFLDLNFEHGIARGHHVCGADIYDAEYRLKSPNAMLVAFRVRGPRKNFCAVSLMRR